MKFPIYDFGGDGPILNLAVANGFPPQVYRSMVTSLLEKYHVISLLPKALWGDQVPPEEYINWRSGLAQDLDKGIDSLNIDNIVAVGHSFGGIASLLSVIRDPSRFKALILLDPTLMVPEVLQALDLTREQGHLDQFPLATRAVRRKRTFESHEAALHYFASKPLFADWDEESLRLYAYEAFADAGEDGVALVWPPEWEAFYFKTIDTQIWEKVPELNGLVPTLVIRGGDSDTFVEAGEAKMREFVPDGTYQVIEGHGHLFPMSAPQETSQRMMSFLQSL